MSNSKIKHLITCLTEEAIEIALELGKIGCKANRFGANDTNVDDPSGPTNSERLVSELNDLIAVADMLAERGVLPIDWNDYELQRIKKDRTEQFYQYSLTSDQSKLLLMAPQAGDNFSPGGACPTHWLDLSSENAGTVPSTTTCTTV